MSIRLKISGLDAAIKDVNRIATTAKKDVQAALNEYGRTVERDAKVLAPADEGGLRQEINFTPGNLTATITVAKNYAAFMEFGTRKFAAAYVSSLPQDWQTYAATFRGDSGGTFAEFLQAIMGWVKRKGIDDKAAYPIALSILRNGVRPHPFLYPAATKPATIKQLEDYIKAIFE